MQRFFFALLLGAIFAFLPTTASAQTDMSDKTVVQIASENGDFSSLVSAVKQAGLAETLSGTGPFTIFAPNNAAFGGLSSQLDKQFMNTEDKTRMTNILKYHVVPGKFTSADLMKMFEGNGDDFDLEPLFGDEFEVEKYNGGMRISDEAGRKINFVSTDIMGSNGIIHVIDRVMLPGKDSELEDILEAAAGGVGSAAGFVADKATSAAETVVDAGETAVDAVADVFDDNNDADYQGNTATTTTTNNNTSVNQRTYRSRNVGNSVVDVASANADFSTLQSALTSADLVDALNSADGVTVFAPSNAAFDALPDGTLANLTRRENQSQLQDILKFHVIPARISAAQLMSAIEKNPRNQYLKLQTLGGKTLYAFTKNGSVYLVDGKGSKVRVTQTDVSAGNGVIHAVESVLMPYQKY